MTFTVTQKHIDHGVRADSCGCPLALAALDDIPGIRTVSVGPSIILALTDSGSRRFHLPLEACAFMRDFDTSHVVHPFSFEAEEA